MKKAAGTTTKPRVQPNKMSVHEKYKTIEILGQGTYGVVYKAENRLTGELVAMKRCRLDGFRDFGIPETTLREIALLKDLRHENIMTLHHVSCNTERLYLVSEYLDYDLKKYLRAMQTNGGLSIDKVKKLIYGILKGLAYCHGHRVIHRDLKPHNVLVSADASKIRIADFGLARSGLAPGKTLTHEVITLWYRAPELLLGHCNYTTGVDIWSVGCIMAELLSSRPLYVGDSEIDTLFRILRLLGTPAEEDWPEHAVVPWSDLPFFAGKPDRFTSLNMKLDPAGVDLLERMFCFNSNNRISALQAIRHPWFADLAPPNIFSEVYLWRNHYPADAFYDFVLPSFVGDENEQENQAPRPGSNHRPHNYQQDQIKPLLRRLSVDTALQQHISRRQRVGEKKSRAPVTEWELFGRLRRNTLSTLIGGGAERRNRKRNIINDTDNHEIDTRR